MTTPRPQVPVIVLAGYLGAGKTTLLNHVLRQPGARVGVVINDFGDINVDAAWVSGQIDEPAAISGGCLCCISDTNELDTALERLAAPRLRLDAIIVEASGLADPATLARMVRFSGAEGTRLGGVAEVVDAVHHAHTAPSGHDAATRWGAASLVVVNKLDLLSPGDRAAYVGAIADTVHARNPRALVVGTSAGSIDPALLYGVSEAADDPAQLPLRELLLEEARPHPHVHADAVSVRAPAGADPGRVIDLLERPPAGVYRMKGTVVVRSGTRWRSYAVNLVGSSIHVASAPRAERSELAAIGLHLDVDTVRHRLDHAVAPGAGAPPAVSLRRLQRYRRLSR